MAFIRKESLEGHFFILIKNIVILKYFTREKLFYSKTTLK